MSINYFSQDAFAANHFANDQLYGGVAAPVADGCYFGSYVFQAQYFGNHYFCGEGVEVAPGDGCYFGSYVYQAYYFGSYHFCGEGVPTPPTPEPTSQPAASGGGSTWALWSVTPAYELYKRTARNSRGWARGRRRRAQRRSRLKSFLNYMAYKDWRKDRDPQRMRKTRARNARLKPQRVEPMPTYPYLDDSPNMELAQARVSSNVGWFVAGVAIGALCVVLWSGRQRPSKQSKRTQKKRR